MVSSCPAWLGGVCVCVCVCVCGARGGHSYTHCTDTRDRDQNLIELIFGLDRLIAPLNKP